MSFRDLVYEIMTALRANKGRSALTILGIVIGIAAVVTMTSLIAGMRQQLLSEVGADQSRILQLSSYEHPFDMDDIAYLEDSFPEISSVGALANTGSVEVATKAKKYDASLSTVIPGTLKMSKKTYALNKGRYFLRSDGKAARQVCILDASLTKKLFGSEDADVVGSSIRIGTDNYSIIGTLKPSTGLAANFMGGGTVYIPSSTAQARMGVKVEFYNVASLIKEGHDVEKLKPEFINAMYKRYPNAKRGSGNSSDGSGTFSAVTSQDAIKIVDSVTSVFTAILSSVAGISLIVGGIGIMNMMLTNVTERIREIGLRKSIGAKARDITNQFLGESIVLCLTGGIIGLIFGYLAALGISFIIKLIQPTMTFVPVITPGIALTAFGVSAFIGIIFGWGPAHRAAKLDPVESLRHQ